MSDALMMRRRALMQRKAAEPPKPPSRFIPMEYLQGAIAGIQQRGTRIDTGLAANMVDRVVLDCQNMARKDGGIFGAYRPSFYLFTFWGDGEWGANYSNKYVGIKGVDLARHVFDISGKGILLDGVQIAKFDLPITQNSSPLYLFDRSNFSGEHYTGKIYGYSAYRNGTLLQHLIPVYDNEMGKPAMFDTVAQKAFYNAGEGEFLYG